MNTTIEDFGTSLCAPIPYEPFFLFFEAVGYSIGEFLPPPKTCSMSMNGCLLLQPSEPQFCMSLDWRIPLAAK